MLSMPACEKKKPEAPAPPVVEVVEVIQKDVPIYEQWVGTADGLVNATIRAQVQGYLIRQNYREGDFVNKGQTLFEIDPRTFQAALDQAKGQLAVQQASWDTAKANLKRIKPSQSRNAVSQKDLDDATEGEQAALFGPSRRRLLLKRRATSALQKLLLGGRHSWRCEGPDGKPCRSRGHGRI
jgi:membrane fusion protein (multidrug efflux system)